MRDGATGPMPEAAGSDCSISVFPLEMAPDTGSRTLLKLVGNSTVTYMLFWYKLKLGNIVGITSNFSNIL